ncbi:uncharacterized protein LOC129457421 [Periophthalmus magnuspinnatus]|uniref:uncharacterized protein LOC129457421 n=1 Tax=Periophthalmus magnuspinnatus TaxID=409849 RepID=UPI0024366452|nr:uncharacterized protein LOC129457421 [Periophthalmus magnuspinnatus]
MTALIFLLSIDAAQEDGSLGRLVNDDHRHPNCKMKRIMHEAKPHLCLFASRDIQPGEEVTYDYGGSDCPWRTQTEEQPPAAKSSDPHLSRPVEMTPESPPVLVVQTEEQPPAAKSSDPHLSRPVEMTPESPPVLVVQTEEQPPAAKSSDPHLSRPVEMTPESPPVLVVQTEEQPPAAKSSDPHLSRPVEMTPESPPVLVVQVRVSVNSTV